MPKNAIPIGSSIALVLSIFAFIISFLQIFKLEKTLRKIAVVSTIQTILFAFLHASLLFTLSMNSASWVFIFLWLLSMEMMNVLLLLTIAEPIYLMLGKGVDQARIHVYKFGLITAICIVPLLVPSAYATSDPFKEYEGLVPYEKEMTISVSVGGGTACIVTLMCTILLIFIITKLENEIKSILESKVIQHRRPSEAVENNSERYSSNGVESIQDDPLQIHLNRLFRLKFGVFTFCFVTVGIMSSMVVIFFHYRSLPRLWIFLYIGLIPLHFVVALVPLLYAKRYKHHAKPIKSGMVNAPPERATSIPNTVVGNVKSAQVSSATAHP